MADIKTMQLGQIIDYCIEHQKRQDRAEAEAKRREKRGNRRKASQTDIDNYFG